MTNATDSPILKILHKTKGETMKAKGPLYIEVAENIKSAILNGVYPVGTQIPTENELEQTFNVSKITVRKAIEILSNEGYVEKKSGKGTTVLSDRLFNKLSKAASFSSMIEASGHHLTKEILAVEKVKLTVDQTELTQIFGKQAFKLTRFYRLDEEPYIYFEHYLPTLGNEKNLIQMEQISLYKWLASHQKVVARFQDSFSVEEVSQEIKTLLATDQSHLLKRKRTSYSQTGEIIEISYALYDTIKYPYLIEYEI